VAAFSATAVGSIPPILPGDDLARVIVAAAGPERLRSGPVIAIAHTAVSKAEGALVELSQVSPGERALELAEAQGRDARLLQVILDEASEVLRSERGVLITRTTHGFVCANSGVDASNSTDRDTVVLLPRRPDESARRIRAGIARLVGGERAPAVLITDSFGRAWRHGQVDVAIGLAGMGALDDWRGRTDANGMPLLATWIAVADAAAAAADLARSKDSGEPVVLLDGLERFQSAQDGPGAAELLRAIEEDLFR